MLKGSQFARKCERKFGGSPLAGGPKLQQIEKYKFCALFGENFFLGAFFFREAKTLFKKGKKIINKTKNVSGAK